MEGRQQPKKEDPQSKPKEQQWDEEDMFEVLPELSPEESKKLEEEYRSGLVKFYQESSQYQIEWWYEQLKQHTAESHSFELTNLEAYLLNQIYQENSQKLQTPLLRQTHHKLAAKVDKFIKEKFPYGCFFKLSTRSPKDYSWRYDSVQEQQIQIKALYQKLAKLKLPFGKELINAIYRYFLEQSKGRVRVQSGQQFIETFSHSERIQIDINDLLYIRGRAANEMDQGNYERGDDSLLKVWGRKWVDCQWMEEFRCFFHDLKPTAISQYDQRCYFPQIEPKAQQIKHKIVEFFQLIKPGLSKLGLDSGAMDVIVRFREESITAELIEINVFSHNCRGSLFSWKTEEHILTNGPLEMRYLREPIEISRWELTKLMGMIQRGIDPIVTVVMEKLGFFKEWQQMK